MGDWQPATITSEGFTVYELTFVATVRAAVAAEQHEEWMEGSRYLNAELLREPIKPMKTTMTMTE